MHTTTELASQESLQKLHTAATTRVEELKTSLDTITAKYTRASAECSKLRKEQVKIIEDCSKLRKEQSKIVKERSQLIAEGVEYSKQVEHLETLLEEEQMKRNTYQQKQDTLLAQLKKEAGEVKKQGLQLQEIHDSSIASLENEQSLLNLENEVLEEEIKTTKSYGEELRRKLLSKYQELERQRASLAQQQKENVELNFEKEMLSTETNALHEQLRDLQEAKADSDREITSLKTLLKKTNIRLLAMQNKAVVSRSSVEHVSNTSNHNQTPQSSMRPIEFSIDAGTLVEDGLQNFTKEECKQLQALTCSLQNDAEGFLPRFLDSLASETEHATNILGQMVKATVLGR